MTDGRFSPSKDPVTENPNPFADDDDDDLSDDDDTASQRSISLSSPPTSPKLEPGAFTSSPMSLTPMSLASTDGFVRAFHLDISPNTPLEPDPPSAYTPDVATSEWNQQTAKRSAPAVESAFIGQASHMYPSTPPDARGDTESGASFSTGPSMPKKAQRESMLLNPLAGPVILGIALVDFNHIVGPKIEFHEGEIFEDEEIAKILPFLALPDGAHLVIDPVITNSRCPYSECSTQVLFHLVF